MDSKLPGGFEPLFRTGPFLELIGPLYQKRDHHELVVGFYVLHKHTNARGFLHGGVICSLADVALGYSCAFSTQPPTAIVTTHLNVDFVGAIRLDDWVEIHTDIQKMGRNTCFANCYFHVDGRRLARASGVFQVIDAGNKER